MNRNVTPGALPLTSNYTGNRRVRCARHRISFVFRFGLGSELFPFSRRFPPSGGVQDPGHFVSPVADTPIDVPSLQDDEEQVQTSPGSNGLCRPVSRRIRRPVKRCPFISRGIFLPSLANSSSLLLLSREEDGGCKTKRIGGVTVRTRGVE